MKRITISPDCEVKNCSDLLGFPPTAALLNDCMRHLDCKHCAIYKALRRLKEYEDAGLTPEQIRRLTVHTLFTLIPKEDRKDGCDN